MKTSIHHPWYIKHRPKEFRRPTPSLDAALVQAVGSVPYDLNDPDDDVLADACSFVDADGDAMPVSLFYAVNKKHRQWDAGTVPTNNKLDKVLISLHDDLKRVWHTISRAGSTVNRIIIESESFQGVKGINDQLDAIHEDYNKELRIFFPAAQIIWTLRNPAQSERYNVRVGGWASCTLYGINNLNATFDELGRTAEFARDSGLKLEVSVAIGWSKQHSILSSDPETIKTVAAMCRHFKVDCVSHYAPAYEHPEGHVEAVALFEAEFRGAGR